MFKAINQKTPKNLDTKQGIMPTVKRKAEDRCSVAHFKRMKVM